MSIIAEQDKLRKDIYKILTTLGMKPAESCNASSSTRNGIHRICRYYFNKDYDNWGVYQYYISVDVPVNYTYPYLLGLVWNEVWKKIRVDKPYK